MLPYFANIAPVFLLILTGYLLRRNGFPNVDFWNMNDKLGYWVLFPALLFTKTSTIELTPDLMQSYAVIVLGAFFIACVASIIMSKLAGLPGTAASSVFQGSTRHNTFIALALAGAFYGETGVATAALVSAILIPVTNLVNVPTMLALHAQKGDGNILGRVFRDLLRNPFILSIALGLTLNILNLAPIPIIHDTTDLISNAALPIVLLSVGANLKIRSLKTAKLPLFIAATAKLAIFPLAIWVIAGQFDLTEMELFCAMAFGAVPCAAASFTLSRQLGGDHQLMASIITVETGIAFFTLPLTFWLLQTT